MIRFNCPHCGRSYELPDALARLPLVCKQCGQRITPPEPTPEPVAPPAKPFVAPTAPKFPAAIPVAPKSPPAAKSTPAEANDPLVVKERPTASLNEPTRANDSGTNAPAHPTAELPLATELDAAPGINLDLLPQAPPAKLKPVKVAAPSVSSPTAPEPTMLPFIVDLIVFLALLALGAFLGELLVKKPTGEILSEAGAAPKFPPTDLLLWAAPAVIFGLIYLLLGKRGRTVGEWIRRRQSQSQ
ncbi:MAG: hypothetical protein L0241_19925 [Planctomycetia bacterium]|nr:hypothetical protein [Planctomycetia bacterium]